MLSRYNEKKSVPAQDGAVGVFDSIFLYLKVKWWLPRLWAQDKDEWISFSAQN